MDHFVGHLVRRGVDAHASYSAGRPDGNHDFQMPAWGVVSLTATAISFFVALGMINYTYGHIVATLAMVESPTAVLFETLPNNDPDAPLDEKKPLEPEIVLVKQAPLTSSFRKTILHLRAHGGPCSRFRGLSVYFVYQIVFSHLTRLFAISKFVPSGVDGVLAAIVLTGLRMAWTHIVISEPSPKYWFQRIPSIKLWKKVAVPTAILAISEQLSIGLPVYLFHTFHLHKIGPQEVFSEMDDTARQVLAGKVFTVFILGLFTTLAIVVPASVSLTRVQASLLPEDEDTIVPFDRSFGGNVIPKVAWGNGIIDMLSAWKTFDWNSRIRLIKVYIKVAAMQFGLTLLFLAAILLELHIFVGEDLQKILQIASGAPEHDIID